jgi:DNA-binding beta-propeller fold protein YncE
LGVAVSGGLVYVGDDSNNRVARFDPTNFAASFTSFGSLGSGSGQFNGPDGVAVSGGLVYVADSGNNRIARFDQTNFDASFTSFGSLGSGAGQFNSPEGVAVDGSGNVFVADNGNNRIVELATVPEPSSLVLGALEVLAVLVAWGMRRRGLEDENPSHPSA